MKKRTDIITISMTNDETCDILSALTAIIIQTNKAIYDSDTDEEYERQKAELKKWQNIRDKIENQFETWWKETSND